MADETKSGKRKKRVVQAVQVAFLIIIIITVGMAAFVSGETMPRNDANRSPGGYGSADGQADGSTDGNGTDSGVGDIAGDGPDVGDVIGGCDTGNGGAGSEQKFCTMDAKMCPDGSYVGRDPENGCEFRACPGF